jgi:uncharacterized protein YqhQ
MKKFLQYGGQAVIEGVMMRSPRFFAVACRKPDGTIIVQEEPVEKTWIGKLGWLNKPFLRGTLALIDSMALGIKALNFAAGVQAESLTNNSLENEADPVKNAKTQKINDIAIGSAMVFAIVFGLILFVALPTLLTQLIQTRMGFSANIPLPYSKQVLLNVVDGVIRITIFLGYLAMISRMEHVKRVFQYHGAEHKAINTLESGLDLNPESCMGSSRIHPRCGTSFIIIVLIASILVHSLFPRPPIYLFRLALHIALIPIVAGISYEIIKLAGRFRESILTSILLSPGLSTQKLTTREPDVMQMEVALAALKAVMIREEETPETASGVNASIPLESGKPS